MNGRYAIAGVAIVAVVAGALVAPAVYGAVTGPDGTVSVVEIDGTIDSTSAQHVEDELRNARRNESVQAVVLEVESGGGLPAQSERMYAAVDRTAAEMPVIAAVDTLGASGAYLAISPADEIYVAPSAQSIGSVGVAGTAPAPSAPSAGTTGPDKRGGNPNDLREEQQTLANLFVASVIEQRGEEIELDRAEIAHAESYLGTEAVANGFADEVGFVDGAIADAAAEAGLDSYEVATHRTESSQSLALPSLDGSDEVVVAESDDRLDDDLILAVAPEVWDETVDDDLRLVSYSGRLPADSTAPVPNRTATQTTDDRATAAETGGEGA